MTMRLIAALLLSVTVATAAPTVTLSPDFTFPGPGNKTRTLRSLHGQPVVMVFADSPKVKLFRKQLKVLRRGYGGFASRSTIFMAVFRDGTPTVDSNVPFVVVPNGAAVADRYGVKDPFNVAIIGIDGNLEYQTANVVAPERIIDILQNGYANQAGIRKEPAR